MNFDSRPCYCGTLVHCKSLVEHIFKCKTLHTKFDKLMKSIHEVGKNANYTDLDMLCNVSDYIKNECNKMRNCLDIKNGKAQKIPVKVEKSISQSQIINQDPVNKNYQNIPYHEDKKVMVIDPKLMLLNPPPQDNILPQNEILKNPLKQISPIIIDDARKASEESNAKINNPIMLMENHFNDSNQIINPLSQSSPLLFSPKLEMPVDDPAIQMQPKQIKNIPPNGIILDKNEEIKNNSNILNPSPKLQIANEPIPLIQEANQKNMQDYVECWKCKSTKPINQIIFPASCSDAICKQCLSTITIEQLPKEDVVKCKCGVSYNRSDILQAITSEKYEELLSSANPFGDSITECPSCHAKFLFEEGKMDYNVKDKNGMKLTKECAEDFCKNRVRCTLCNKDFCKKCHLAPYHLGMTCSEQAHMQLAT